MYHNLIFTSVANSANGEVDATTRFHYRQEGDLASGNAVVWATYAGGGVTFGTLVAKAAPDGSLDMRYSHVNRDGKLMTGLCRSTPERLPDGRIRLHERWQWTSGDGSSGESVVEQVN